MALPVKDHVPANPVCIRLGRARTELPRATRIANQLQQLPRNHAHTPRSWLKGACWAIDWGRAIEGTAWYRQLQGRTAPAVPGGHWLLDRLRVCADLLRRDIGRNSQYGIA